MNWKKSYAVFALLFLLLGLTACSGNNEENVLPGGLKIEFSYPDQVKSGQVTEYTVKITKDNQPLENAEVIVMLEMAEMDHGKNGFRGKMTEPGVYKGEAVLPMGGDWIAYVRVKTADIETTKDFSFKAEGNMLSTEELEKVGLDKNGAKLNPDF
jgi:hypothetical protein